jgi:hypothetical protein
MLIMPVLAPPYTSDSLRAQESQLVETKVEGRVNISEVPGIPSGHRTKLPVIAVFVLGWSNDGKFSKEFSFAHEQVAYMLVEQASMVLWNCQKVTVT